MRRLKLILLSCLSIYGAALLALYIFQQSFLYIPPSVYLMPSDVKLNNVVEVSDADRPQSLQGWWIAPKSADNKVVMHFHGNGSAVYSNHQIFRALSQQGHGVFALAYPGYPGRAGKPTQDSLVMAAETAYDYIISQGVSPENIIYYGTSLGSGVAAQLAVNRKPALLIMEAPFTSVADMAKRSFPIFPTRRLTRDKFESVKALKGLNVPLIWIHGTQDNVIPITVGETLYTAYDGPKTAHIFEGAGHNNLWQSGGDKIVLDALQGLSAIETAH